MHHRKRTLDQRAEFERDRDRLLYSDALRRLQGVTQVVSADEGWVFHNRLTHSIKVAQIARRIAEHLVTVTATEDIDRVGGLSPDVAEAAGLAHDLGHPPFGHVAEARLGELTGKIGFEGNAQSFRIVTRLEAHHHQYRGLNLTRATLGAVLKYPRPHYSPGSKTHHKFGYYSESEIRDFQFAREGEVEPDKGIRTLEAEIMDLADDITFAIHDTEDFYRAGMIPLYDLRPDRIEFDRFLDDIRRRWDRQERDDLDWDAHVEALKEVLFTLAVNSTFHGTRDERVSFRRAASGIIGGYVREGLQVNKEWPSERRVRVDEDIRMQIRMLKQLVWIYVIDRPSLATQQAGHSAIIERLFRHFLESLEKDRLQRLPTQFHTIVKQRNPGEEPNERLAADMVCSLTDRQALVLYRRITGLDPGAMAPFAF